MSETACMYTLQPLVKMTEKIDYPKCIYSMKNIQTSGSNSQLESVGKHHAADNGILSVLEQVNNFLKKPMPGMKELEVRQEAILKQLTELKEQVMRLKANLKLPSETCKHESKPAHTSAHLNENVKDSLTGQDIVINASPKHPPYALLALCHLWRDSLSFKISWHTHSNIEEIPTDIKDLMQTNGKGTTNNTLHHVKMLIVWKDVGVDTELVVSPMSRISIRGEVNILRYLSRLGPCRYNYEAGNDHIVATKMDAVLDTCHSLAWSRTVKDKQTMVRSLSATLGKSQYLAGDNVSIADIAAWSVLYREPNLVKDLTTSMSKWYQRCNGLFTSSL